VLSQPIVFNSKSPGFVSRNHPFDAGRGRDSYHFSGLYLHQPLELACISQCPDQNPNHQIPQSPGCCTRPIPRRHYGISASGRPHYLHQSWVVRWIHLHQVVREEASEFVYISGVLGSLELSCCGSDSFLVSCRIRVVFGNTCCCDECQEEKSDCYLFN